MREPDNTLILDTPGPRDAAAGMKRGALPCPPETPPRPDTAGPARAATAGTNSRFLVAFLRALAAWPV